MRLRLSLTVAFAATLVQSFPVRAQTPVQIPFDTLVTSVFPVQAGFASSLKIDGDLLIAGAENSGLNPGSAYLFERTPSGWSEIVELAALVPVSTSVFGFSVDVSGTTAAVGSPNDDELGDAHGAVFLFEETGPGTWEFDQKLLPPAPEVATEFGTYLGIDGDHLVIVGYELESPFTVDHVYTYERQSGDWVHTQTFNPCCSIPYEDCFDMDGDTFALGGDLDNPNGSSSGSVSIYRRTGSTWALEDKIVPADGAAYDQFGRGVGLSGNTLVVGAPPNSFFSTPRPGKAYVYVRDGQGQWALEQTILSPEPALPDLFGRAVDAQGDTAVVAAPFNHASNFSNSFVYTRESGVWREHLTLDAVLDNSSGLFGTATAIDGDRAWIGEVFGEVAHGFEISRDLTIANPLNVAAGETLTVTTCLGQPGALMLLFAVDINGSPTFQRLTTGLFDTSGQVSFSVDVLPGLQGNTVDFASVFKGSDNKLVLTDPVKVTFD